MQLAIILDDEVAIFIGVAEPTDYRWVAAAVADRRHTTRFGSAGGVRDLRGRYGLPGEVGLEVVVGERREDFGRFDFWRSQSMHSPVVYQSPGAFFSRRGGRESANRETPPCRRPTRQFSCRPPAVRGRQWPLRSLEFAGIAP